MSTVEPFISVNLYSLDLTFSFPRWKFTNITKWNGTYRMCVAYSSNIFTGCTIFHGQGSLVYNLTSSLKIRKYIIKYLIIFEFLRCLWEQKVFNISSGIFMTPHCVFLDHWNRRKILSSIKQCFSRLIDEGITKICKKNWLFQIIHIIHFVMQIDRSDKSENIFAI